MSRRGLSKSGLKRLHDAMAGYVERREIPGLVTLICRRGKIHVDALGTLAIGDDRPVERDSIFRIASMTKPVVATAAMMLAEECKLRLDEPVDRLLPELANRQVLKRLDGPIDETVPANRPVLVRDLLTFTMGFGLIMAPPGKYPIQKATTDLGIRMGPPRPQEQPPPDEWVRRLGTLPLMHQPGERWLYDTPSDMLGVLIARAAGMPLEEYLQESIFEPLGMVDTAFSVPAEKMDRFTTCYWNGADGTELTVFDEARDGHWSRPPAFPSGGGGLVSTVDDYLKFGQMLLDKGKLLDTGKMGEKRLLSRYAVETMVTDQLTPAQKAASGLIPGYFDNHGWGFGVSVVTRRNEPSASIGKFGWDGGLGTSWRSDPQEELVTILLTNRCWTSPNPPNVCRDFWTLAYRAIDD